MFSSTHTHIYIYTREHILVVIAMYGRGTQRRAVSLSDTRVKKLTDKRYLFYSFNVSFVMHNYITISDFVFFRPHSFSEKWYKLFGLRIN